MSSHSKRKVKLAAAWTLFGVAGLAGGWLNRDWRRQAMTPPQLATSSAARELAGAAVQGALGVWLVLGGAVTIGWLRRRLAEQRDALRNLSAAMEQSRSAVMVVDRDGRVEFANRGLCELFGYARPKLIGARWRDIMPAPANVGAEEILAIAREGKWEGRWACRRADGAEHVVQAVVAPVRRRDGTTAAFVAVFDDVSGMAQREAELREARDRAEAGDRAKGQFLATMSHEVRTPLNGIAGFTSLLLDTNLTPDQRDCVQTIKASAEALIQLTGDILDFARIESGKLALDPTPCDPRECVEDAIDFAAARAAEKNVELLHRVAASVPASVIIDGGRLRQVLINLVGNAVKFTHKGEVEVGLALAPDEAAPADAPPPASCLLVFTVRDTGIGIAAEHHEKLFRPFTQVEETTTRRYGGTGLGLAICRNLVELMGGEIRFTSELGRGSHFIFTVRATIAAGPPAPPSLRGMRVGLAIRATALRRELADLVTAWGGAASEARLPEELAGGKHEAVLIDLDQTFARELMADPAPLAGLSPETLLGLVPISLSHELRAGLRVHFRLLVNKPAHHGAFFALLSGLHAAPPAASPVRFGFRVLVVEHDAARQLRVQRALDELGCSARLANESGEALAQLAHGAEDFDLVLLDFQAPETGGGAVLREIRAGRAGARAQAIWIIALNATAHAPHVNGHRTELNDFLPALWQAAELEAALRRFRAERLARPRSG